MYVTISVDALNANRQEELAHMTNSLQGDQIRANGIDESSVWGGGSFDRRWRAISCLSAGVKFAFQGFKVSHG